MQSLPTISTKPENWKAERFAVQQAGNGHKKARAGKGFQPMEERFTPQMTVDHFTSLRGIAIEDIGIAPVVVISWGRNVIPSLANMTDAQPSPYWFYGERQPFFTGSVQGKQVSFVQAPVGASGTVMMMEEMIACGAKTFLGVGWAGSLQPTSPLGTYIIPTNCIREEGTSFHYLDENVNVGPDQWLVELLHQCAKEENAKIACGPLWTTDAPYREFYNKVESYSRQGVTGVDMETSAMYALGQFRGVRVCNLLVVSDELWQDWRPAFGSQELRESTHRAQRIILKVLKNEWLYQ